jgi:hypothetical protein
MATVGLKSRGDELLLHEGGLDAFRHRFSGTLVCPGEDGYDAARAVWNGMIDRHPALIAYCTSRRDVLEAIAFASATGILTAIRSGGHNIAGGLAMRRGSRDRLVANESRDGRSGKPHSPR